MLAFISILLAMMLLVSRRTKGPLWAFGIAWIVCLFPIVTGLIRYEYLDPGNINFATILLALLLCFILGVTAHDLTNSSKPHSLNLDLVAELHAALPWAKVAWFAGMIGTIFLIIDFTALGGAGLDDLATLRELYLTKNATFFAQLASVLTWGCLYCFAFAMTFRGTLTRRQYFHFLAPVCGYFLVALFSAGRQATMQLLIFSLLIYGLQQTRRSREKSQRKSSVLTPLLISLLMISYMGFIAVARDDGQISTDRTEVLAMLFDFETATLFNDLIAPLSTGIRSTIVEALVYFSSSVALFSKFLTIEFSDYTFGAMSLPFVFRQLEPLTGLSVVGALDFKITSMKAAGVIGHGWTTGISSYILDFGIVGAAVILFLQGYYSAFTWRRARHGYDFHEGLIALLTLTAAIYLPLVPASSDTNLLLLWIFCLIALACRSGRKTLLIIFRSEKNAPARGL